eukprot:scpid11271/ scgid17915/ 
MAGDCPVSGVWMGSQTEPVVVVAVMVARCGSGHCSPDVRCSWASSRKCAARTGHSTVHTTTSVLWFGSLVAVEVQHVHATITRASVAVVSQGFDDKSRPGFPEFHNKR